MQNNGEQNAVAQNLDVPVYSSIDRRANLSIGQIVSYSTTPKRKPNYLEKRKGNIASVGQAGRTVNTATKKGHDELNIIDVSFETKPNDYKFKIHGSKYKTNYVDKDFSKEVCSFADGDDDFTSMCDVEI